MGDGQGRRASLTVIVVIAVVLVYFFVFAEPLYPELSAVPAWKVSLIAGKASGGGTAGEGYLAYSAGDRFGYFSPEGEVAFIDEAPGGAPISDASYISKGASAPKAGFALERPSGETIATLASTLPFYSAGRLFSAEDDGNGVSAYDDSGKRLWSYTFPSRLSAFASGAGLLVGGTVDGWLEGVAADGTRAFSFAPGGSRLSVVLGLGVSRSGDWVAAVSGIDKQRLVILGRGGTDYRVASHRYLETDFREPVRVIVMDDDRHVLYRRPDGIGVWAVDGSVDSLLPVKADDFDVALDEARGIAYLVARRGVKAEIVAFKLPATLLGRIALPERSEFVRFSGSSAFIGGTDWLARFDFVEE